MIKIYTENERKPGKTETKNGSTNINVLNRYGMWEYSTHKNSRIQYMRIY
jgi:hypothetical protein